MKIKMNFLFSSLFLLIINTHIGIFSYDLSVKPQIVYQDKNSYTPLHQKPPASKIDGICIKWINQIEMDIQDGHGAWIHRPAQATCYRYASQRHQLLK